MKDQVSFLQYGIKGFYHSDRIEHIFNHIQDLFLDLVKQSPLSYNQRGFDVSAARESLLVYMVNNRGNCVIVKVIADYDYIYNVIN